MLQHTPTCMHQTCMFWYVLDGGLCSKHCTLAWLSLPPWLKPAVWLNPSPCLVPAVFL
jgi:hypothetical protein